MSVLPTKEQDFMDKLMPTLTIMMSIPKNMKVPTSISWMMVKSLKVAKKRNGNTTVGIFWTDLMSCIQRKEILLNN